VVFRVPGGEPEFVLIKAMGRWSFPKGMVERGESAEQTALREIAEETGLPAASLRLSQPLPTVEYAYRWEGVLVFKTLHNFLVEALTDAPLNPQLSEIEDARWFAGGEALQTLSFKNTKETLQAAMAALLGRKVRQ
jgi:8-oxo-dGTP pyrophosphatase MutT (NUDIX family)